MMSRLVSTVAARASRQARLLIAADLISRNCASFSRVARPVATFSVASALARLPLHSATTRHRFAPHCALQAQSRRFASASTASSPKTAPAPAAPPAPFATVVSSPIPVGADQALRITDSCVQVHPAPLICLSCAPYSHRPLDTPSLSALAALFPSFFLLRANQNG